MTLSQVTPSDAASKKQATATFAGGCFWCLQPRFDKLPGVISTSVGYTGGHIQNPTYDQVCSGRTGHLEAIQVVYNPSKLAYDKLLDTFWKIIDPTQVDGQFADKGTQYQTAIFFHSEEQRTMAEKSKVALGQSGKFKKPIVTTIRPAVEFFHAEEYHQKFYQKSPEHYQAYSVGSGRHAFVCHLWGKDAE